MRRLRAIVSDVNQIKGSMAIPLRDDCDISQADGLMDLLLAVIKPVIYEGVFMSVIQSGTGAGATGTTPTCGDLAVMTFASSGPFGLRVALLGPGDIFLPDGLTIDASLTPVANLIAAVIELASDCAGNELTEYVSGRRIA